MSLRDYLEQEEVDCYHLLLQQLNEENMSHTSFGSYMDIAIENLIDTENGKLVKIRIMSQYGQHQENTTEWHDMLWCAHWQVATELKELVLYNVNEIIS